MDCANCSAELRASDIFCPTCGAKQEKKASVQEPEAPDASGLTTGVPSIPKNTSNFWPILIVLIIAIAALVAWSSNTTNSQRTSENQTETSSSEIEAEPPEPPAPWYPAGFQELTSNLAYQALPVEQMNCGYSSAHSCYQIYLVSNIACTAFIDVNFLINDVIIDQGIDSANMTAGGQAILTFASLTAAQYEGDKKVQIIEASCY